MPNVIIEHPDGRRYSTSSEGFHRVYESEGFAVVGEESDASFELEGIPTPKTARRSRAKGAKPAVAKKAKPAAAAPAPEPAPAQAEDEPA